MRRYIIADNHELTRFALQSLLKRDGNVVVTAVNRAELVELLKEYEDAIVILDYTLFDFQDEEQLLIISERFSMASWILLSDDLPKAFLKKVIYASHAFSVVFKDEPIKEISYAIQSVADGKRYVSQCATEILLSQQQEKEKPAVPWAVPRRRLPTSGSPVSIPSIPTARIFSGNLASIRCTK